MLNVDRFVRSVVVRVWLDAKLRLQTLPRRQKWFAGAATLAACVVALLWLAALRSGAHGGRGGGGGGSGSGTQLAGHYDLFVAVISSPDHLAQREAARQTWLRYAAHGRAASGRPLRVAHRFFIGLWPDSSARLRRRLEFESRVHGDVVQLDSLDTYDRLPFKTIALMRWLAALDGRNCTVDFLFKTDDDTYVRLDRLHAQLASAPPDAAELLYWGFFNYGSTQTQLPADAEDLSKAKVQRAIKWSDPLFNGTYYPPYALGTGYALAMPLVSRIVRHYERHYAARDEVPSRMEDAATGIYLDEAPGRVHRMEIWWRSTPAVKSGSKTTLCEEALVLRSHVHDLALMRKWHRNFDRCGRMCSCESASLNGTAPSPAKGKKQPAPKDGGEWTPENDLDYTVAQLKWIGKRKETELDRLRSQL